MHKNTITFSGQHTSSFNFEFARAHYNIYPWIAREKDLCRVARTPDGAPVLAVIHETAHKNIVVNLLSETGLKRDSTRFFRNAFSRALGLDDDYEPLARFARKDSVLKAALHANKGIRPKRYMALFESVCGAICAQNVDFRRLYGMMKNIAVSYGPALTVESEVYHAFPLAKEVADTNLEAMRACKVGYRAKLILGGAQWMAKNEEGLGREELQTRPVQEAIDMLCAIPGVGPYSAAIILNAYVGRSDMFHLDSFTRHILIQMYFNGQHADDNTLQEFVLQKWGAHAGYVAHVLTTNTHEWASSLGFEGFRKSGAKA